MHRGLHEGKIVLPYLELVRMCTHHYIAVRYCISLLYIGMFYPGYSHRLT